MFNTSYKEAWAVATRHLILAPLFFLPKEKNIALERRLRGKEEFRKLQETDWVLMSWGKSGRTWFRVMLSRFYQLHFGLPTNHMLEFDNYHRLDARAPRVLFTHNNYMRDYLRQWESLEHFRGKRVVLLVRDPRDVAVSQYFQWRYRMLPRKKELNFYPPHGAEVDIFDFVCNPDCGIPRIVDYFNGWARAMPMMGDNLLVIRYEDMRLDPAGTLQWVVTFAGTAGTAEEIEAAKEYAAYENMKKREAENDGMRASGQRVRPGDDSNPESFKVRRGKVGGYRDYFTPDQLERVDAMVKDRLDPVFGYETE
jgi:hypothetical protein